MRKLTIAEGRGTVEIRGRRATVRVGGHYLGTVAKARRGGWIVPGCVAAYASPADAAEDLADGAAYGQAA